MTDLSNSALVSSLKSLEYCWQALDFVHTINFNFRARVKCVLDVFSYLPCAITNDPPTLRLGRGKKTSNLPIGDFYCKAHSFDSCSELHWDILDCCRNLVIWVLLLQTLSNWRRRRVCGMWPDYPMHWAPLRPLQTLDPAEAAVGGSWPIRLAAAPTSCRRM